ncbi:amidohydrolase family protein [Amycolatopsis pithecellobii]|uniref:Amidohydrolase family protein n=1 Tax=Amycolatopsis pithecellobii TaxID=664692 RepID=A0A6N7Z0P7_9PSEU|nr:amidohydrolase family protein [Amycolatopsis pithecellobii]MTD53044.1 amidohydrolase family protein [Amycolatopsis pithecellobii]
MSDALVDVHAHFVTDEYIAAAKQGGHRVPDNMPAWPAWSAEEHLALMDEVGIDRSILSVSSPGIHFGHDEPARDIARLVNDVGISTARRHPGRFGLFASLPLPDVDGALAEIERVHDRDGVTGYSVMSNAGGVYLGDPRYEPLWQALNRRRATFFVHPTSPPNSDLVSLGRPEPMIEYLFDSARTFVDLIFAGVILRYPDIRFIATHSGGVLPLVTERVERFRGSAQGYGDGKAEESARIQLGRLWFDCAVLPLPTALPTLTSVVGTGRLLLGTDYCFARQPSVRKVMRELDSGEGWLDLFRRNAKALL